MLEREVGTYRLGSLTGDELRAAVADALGEIRGDPADLEELTSSGIDPVELATAEVSISQRPGFVGAAVLLAIGITAGGSLTAEAAKALWNIVLRKVRRDHGRDAIGEEESERAGDE